MPGGMIERSQHMRFAAAALRDGANRAAVPRSDIVLGFHPPKVRPYTKYTVA